jgi:hypothetical protein
MKMLLGPFVYEAQQCGAFMIHSPASTTPQVGLSASGVTSSTIPPASIAPQVGLSASGVTPLSIAPPLDLPALGLKPFNVAHISNLWRSHTLGKEKILG